MPFDLNIIINVITSPNSAFAQIRDNEEKYFVQSIGILIISSILSSLVVLPFVMIHLDDAYFEGVENDVSLPTEESDIMLAILIGIIKGVASFASLYYIGIKLGGNTNWKKVFSVFFHTYVPVIPMMIILSVLVFLMWSSLAEIDPSYLMSPNMDEDEALSAVGPMLGYVGLLVVAVIVFMAWIIVISVKAIKIVDGFETGKAFGLLILVMIISSVVSFVLNA